MAVPTKLGGALLVALISNATLLSMLFTQRSSGDNDNSKDAVSTSSDFPATTVSPEYHSYDAGGGKVTGNFPDRGQSMVSETGDSDSANDLRGSEFQENKEFDGSSGGKQRQPQHHHQQQQQQTEFPPRQQRSTKLKQLEAGHYLDDIISTLTKSELEALEPGVVKVLLPALIGLESLVLRELERLHDVNINQELRIERLEKQQLQNEELLAAAATIREQQEEGKQREQWENRTSTSSPTGLPQGDNLQLRDESSAVIVEYSGESMLQEVGEGSGSGDEASSVTTLTTTTATTTTIRPANHTDSADSAIINHIYEIYSSLTSIEHKVAELGTSLSAVSSEIYRQRSTFINMEDKLEELRRNQRNIVMRTTVHGFKLSDLEQFKAQAEVTLRTAEGELEQFEGRMEVFKDRVTAQQDEMQGMRNVFGRLEQSATELRAADTYKAHDIQELKRGAMQIEQRLASLYHSLDRYIGNIRYDVRNTLDRLCANNALHC